MQLTQIQRVSGNFLNLFRKSSSRVTVLSKIIQVDFFRVGNVFVAHGTPNRSAEELVHQADTWVKGSPDILAN